MAGFSTDEVMFAAGSLVAYGDAGTTEPADPEAATTGFTDLGYISEDGVTLTKSPEEQTFGAWQSPDPIITVETGRTQTLAFSLRQWDPDVLAFALNGTADSDAGPPAVGDFTPSKDPTPFRAMLFRWTWNTYPTQLYIPRGKITGDITAVLARTAPADFAVTFTLLPQPDEDSWHFSSEHPAFASPGAVMGASVGGGFDPGSHTVAEVLDYVGSHPGDRDAVLAAEQAGQNRSTLVTQLQAVPV